MQAAAKVGDISTPAELFEEIRALTIDTEFNEITRIGNYTTTWKLDYNWELRDSLAGGMIKTAGGPGHFLQKYRKQGDHQDGAYGWSRNARLALNLEQLEGGHFEAFRFQSNSALIAHRLLVRACLQSGLPPSEG